MPSICCFHRSMSIAIYDLVLYLQSEELNISWIYSGAILFQYLQKVFAIQYSTLSLTESVFIFLNRDGSIWDLWGQFRQKRIHLFWAFQSLSFKFFFKRGNHEEHSQSKCGWISALQNSFPCVGSNNRALRYTVL